MKHNGEKGLHGRSNTFHSVRDFKLKKPDIHFLAKILPKSELKQPRFLSSKLLYQQAPVARDAPTAASTFQTSEKAPVKSTSKAVDLSNRKRSNQIGSLIKSSEMNSTSGLNFNKRHSSMQMRSVSIGSEGVMTNSIVENKFREAFKKVTFMKTHENKPKDTLHTEKTLPKETSALEESKFQPVQSYRVSSLKLLTVNKKEPSQVVSFRKLEASKSELTAAPKASHTLESSRMKADSTSVEVIRENLVKEFKHFLLNERVSSQLSKNLEYYVKEDDLGRLKDFNTVSDSAREKGSNFLTAFLDAFGDNQENSTRDRKASGSLLDPNGKTGDDVKLQNLFDRKITNEIKEEFQRKKIYTLINNYADKYGIELSKTQQNVTSSLQRTAFARLEPEQQRALLYKRKKSDFRKKFDRNFESQVEQFPNLKKAIEYRNRSEMELLTSRKGQLPTHTKRFDKPNSRTGRSVSSSKAVQEVPETAREALHDRAAMNEQISHRKNFARFPFKFSIGEKNNHSLVYDEALAIKFRILDEGHPQTGRQTPVDELEQVRSESFNRQVR